MLFNTEEQDLQISLDAISNLNTNNEKKKRKFITIKENLITNYTTNIPKTIKIQRSEVKRGKAIYGSFLSYTLTGKQIPNPTNPFFIENRELYNIIYKFFSNKVAHFTAQTIVELRRVIADFGQRMINVSIIENKINQLQLQLIYLDYDRFCKRHTKEFNEKYLEKKLEELFIDFQDINDEDTEGHNKKVIGFIRAHSYKFPIAIDYLNLTFYKLVEAFNELELKDYLEEKDKELRKAYDEYNKTPKNGFRIDNVEERIDAYNKIIGILCTKFKDYSTKIETRKCRNNE